MERIKPGMTIEQMQEIGRKNGAEATASIRAIFGGPTIFTGVDFSNAVYPGPKEDPISTAWIKYKKSTLGKGVRVDSNPTKAGIKFLAEQRKKYASEAASSADQEATTQKMKRREVF